MQKSYFQKCFLLFAFLFSIATTQAQKQKTPSFAVGFSIHDLKDHSRSYLPLVPQYKPIQVSVWYPALQVKKPMAFKNYFEIWRSPSVTIIDSQHYSKNHQQWVQGLGRSLGKSKAPDSLVTIVENQPMRAGWKAVPASGRFPVIITHGSGGDAFAQAIRNEYLASQGYLVVSLPLLNHGAVDFNRGSTGVASMLSMAQDIGFVVNFCQTLPNADTEKIGFAGMHLQAGLTYQTQSQKLSALVVFEDDMTPLSTQPFYDAKTITIPILAVGSEELRPDFSLLDSLRYAERFVLRIPGLSHVDQFHYEKIEKLQRPGSGKNYDTISLFIRQFFDNYLKQSPAANTFFQEHSKPDAENSGSHVVHQKAMTALPTEDEFLAWIRYGKLQQAKTVYEKAKESGAHTSLFSRQRFSDLMLYERFYKNTDELFDMTNMLLELYPSAPVAERFLNGVGYAYLQQKKLHQSIAVFKLGVQHYPQSPNTYDALADGYAAAGDKENTVAFAKKALAVLANSALNAETKQRIEQSAKQKLQRFGEDSLPSSVQRLLDSVKQQHRLPGITATIIDSKGNVFDFASGVADSTTGEKLTPQHKLLSGSTGKMYFAISILLLAEQGKLQLDQKADKYLGNYSWYHDLPNASSITIRQLLNHTAGMEEYFLLGDFLSRLKQQPDKVWKIQELMSYMAGRKPLFPAGSSFSYADTHYVLLQQIIEAVTGKDAYLFIEENIINKLRLNHTIPSIQRVIPALANGYSNPKLPTGFDGAMLQNGKLIINPQFEGGGGGFASNSHDLATLVHTLLNGKLLRAVSLAEMKTPFSAKSLGPNNYYGLGLQIIIRGADTTYGHSGWFPGYASDSEFFSRTGFTIAVQMTTDLPKAGYLHPRQVVHAIHKVLIPSP